MLSANVIETVPILENLLDTNGQPTTTNSKYLVATFNYKKGLQVGRTYWYAYAYRWSNIQGSSLSSGTPTWVGFWYDHGARSAAAGKYDAESTTAGTDYYCSNSFTVTPEVRSDQKFSYCSIYHGDHSQTQDKAVRGQVWCAVMYDITDWKIAYGGKGNSNPEQDLFNIWKARATGAGSEYTDVVYNNIGGNQTKLFVKSDAVCPIELVEYEGLDRYQAQSLLGKLDPFLHNSTLRKYDYNNVLTGGTLTINNDTSNIDPESPFYPNKSESATKITVKGATARSDGKMGGFMYPWKMGEVSSGVVVQKLIAKVPVGYSLQPGDNWPTATKNSQKCKITVPHSVNGTGKYEEYTWIYEWNNCSFSDLPKSNVKEDISKTVSFMSGVFSKSTLVKSNLAAGTYTITNATFTTSANYGGTAQEPLMQGCLVVFKAGEYVVDIQDSLRIAYTRGNVLKVIPITNATYTFSEKFDLVFYNIDSGYLDNWLKNNSDEMVPSIAEYTSSGSLSFSFTLNWQQIGNYWAGYVYIMANSSSVSKTDVTWYVAYYNNIALKDGSKDVSKYKYYTVLPGKDVIGGDKIFTNSVDSQNIFANGDFSDINMPLPSNYEYISDQTILQGKARTAIRQKVGAAASWNAVGPLMKINPLSRYKFSCDIYTTNYTGDFYTALIYYRYADKSDGGYNATNTLYRAGTRTTLAKDLNPGDMNVYLSSMDNWSAGNSFNISTRFLTSDRHNSTLWADDERGVATAYKPNGYVIMKNAYTGSKIASGTTVVESCTGAVYYYPVCQWSNSTTKFKDGWAHYEVFFGTDGNMWDGCNTYWADIPMNAKYVTWCPNGAANTSGNPVYFANIRIEDVGANSSEKQEGKVQLKRYFNNLDYGIGIDRRVLNVIFDNSILRLFVNGTELTASKPWIPIKYNTTVNIAYEIIDTDYHLHSSGEYRKYIGISSYCPNDSTIKGTSFTMPDDNKTLHVVATTHSYYGIVRRKQQNTKLLLSSYTIAQGWSDFEDKDIFFPVGSKDILKIKGKFEDSHNIHNLSVFYGDDFYITRSNLVAIQLINYDYNCNIYIDAFAYTVEYTYYSISFDNLDDSKFILNCNDRQVTGTQYVKNDDSVKLQFYGKEYESSGIWNKYSLINYSPEAYSTGQFIMPKENISITVNYMSKKLYNITTNTNGCTIVIPQRAVANDKVSYSIVFDDSNNRCAITIQWGNYSKEYNMVSGTFTMPAEDVTITAEAWEYTPPSSTPTLTYDIVNGICVYSVSNTVGHRNAAENKSTINSQVFWAGAFQELKWASSQEDISEIIQTKRNEMKGYFRNCIDAMGGSVDNLSGLNDYQISIGSNVVHVIFSIDSQLFSTDQYYILIQPCFLDSSNIRYSSIADEQVSISGTWGTSSDVSIYGNSSACSAYSSTSDDFVLINFSYWGFQNFDDLNCCCSRLAILTGSEQGNYENNFFIDFDYCMADYCQSPEYLHNTYLLPNFGSVLDFDELYNLDDGIRYFIPLGSFSGLYSGLPSHLDGDIMCFNTIGGMFPQYNIKCRDLTAQVFILVAFFEDFYPHQGKENLIGGLTLDGYEEGKTECMNLEQFVDKYKHFIQIDRGNQLITIIPDGLDDYYNDTDKLFFYNSQTLYISLISNNQLFTVMTPPHGRFDLDIDYIAATSPKYSYFGTASSEVLRTPDRVYVNSEIYDGRSLVITN